MTETSDPAGELLRLKRGCTTSDALAFFDRLPPIRAEAITGRFRGEELPTGHPLADLLSASGWYGKEFVDTETVHPLVFREPGGDLFTVDPRKLPTRVAAHVPRKAAEAGQRFLGLLRGLVATSKPRARLRDLEYRGRVSAAMIYDHLPIIDVFRKVDDETLLGAMDQRGQPEPFFFVLRRDGARSG
jgi:hypothetical protein